VIRASKKTVSKNRMVRVLDAACRVRVVIERDRNTCQRCGAVGGSWNSLLMRVVVIQWAHVHTRRHYCLRWEDDATLALCDCCHMWFDHNHILALDWFAKKFSERWERIKRVLQSGTKVDVKSLYKELK